MAKTEKDFEIGIVDDNVQTAISISQILEHNGFKTFQAYNVDDAIRECNSRKPALLPLDLRLGGGKMGYDVAEKIRGQEILFITGYDVDEAKLSKLKNVRGVLAKPIDIDSLLSKVREVLKIPKLAE
jgi:two-component system, response regulator, stage 0 sporulation protein F